MAKLTAEGGHTSRRLLAFGAQDAARQLAALQQQLAEAGGQLRQLHSVFGDWCPPPSVPGTGSCTGEDLRWC